ncbi:MAG: hypothetical protein LUH05_02180 [Candidatus Gastranaerophilales bacterium]|nr:hypothetical protein [Candidatus Gastranaerophilales bacterium]
MGNIQNSKLCNMRFLFGKGYRVYYKELDDVVVLIVTGSDQSNQIKLLSRQTAFLMIILTGEPNNEF